MGWASDAFTNELARAGIFPVRDREYYNYSRRSYCSTEKKEKKKEVKLFYHDYNFPTDAQVRALRFITMHTSIIFEGKTKYEAKLFIREHMEKAREIAENR